MLICKHEQIVNTNYDLVAYLYKFSLAFYPLKITFKVIFCVEIGGKKQSMLISPFLACL